MATTARCSTSITIRRQSITIFLTPRAHFSPLQVTICHCKVNQTYRKFSTRSTSFIPILGFSRRPKVQGKLNKHWLSGKGATATSSTNNVAPPGGPRVGGAAGPQQVTRHLPGQPQTQTTLGGQLQERPFQRHLAMNLENDMYYTVDFSENSQHSPLIQWDLDECGGWLVKFTPRKGEWVGWVRVIV